MMVAAQKAAIWAVLLTARAAPNRARSNHVRTLRQSVLARLLHDVRQFVCEQAPTFNGRGCVTTGAKYDVTSERVRPRVDRSCIRCCVRVRVNPDATEIEPETRLHERARLGIERLTAGARDGGSSFGRGDARP